MYRILCLMLGLIMGQIAFSENPNTTDDLLRLKKAYPDFIETVTKKTVTWKDGTVMPVSDGKKNKTPEEKLNNPALGDQLINVHYISGVPKNTANYQPSDDPGRIRYEPFFKKMYGDSENMVKSNLVTIYWLPKVFDKQYPLLVTNINHVNKKLELISNELEALLVTHPEYTVFLKNPGGTFNWRLIANTNRLSMHSFGMTIDINVDKSNYWQWDLDNQGSMIYHNQIPWEIIEIFEKHGFIWGGKWKHYDTMHFEYRPEVMINAE